MNILVIGQCTLHWGRMEFGNIGNYYIVEPLFRELRRVFPAADVRTTFQLSRRFCDDEAVTVLPMELYYGWRDNELELARAELTASEHWGADPRRDSASPYLKAVAWADLVIDFSGDLWGDNANFLGADRFEVGLIKDLIAMNLGKPTVLLAGSPGPFSRPDTLPLARHVYARFDRVTNREPVSTRLLGGWGFDVNKTTSLACPAFLFEPASGPVIDALLAHEGLSPGERSKPVVGVILCGWNFERGPFDKWPRDDNDYVKFAEAVEYLTEQLGVRVCLMSHANGFDIPPASFKLKHGRDYPIIKQLQEVIRKRGIARDVFALDGVYDCWQTKAIIGTFDMLVSGRVHAAVAGLSQSVPTVIIDYGHEPKAHKLSGFAEVAGVTEYVADPAKADDLRAKIGACWNNRVQIGSALDAHMPMVRELARQNLTQLRELV